MEKKYFIDNIEFDAEELMKMFRDVFNYIGSFILDESDTEIEGLIYEEYDFHIFGSWIDEKLDILLDSGNITSGIKLKAQEMRNLSEKMLGENAERSASIIKNSAEWKRILSLADQIRIFLNKV
jgi:hypothetical protein